MYKNNYLANFVFCNSRLLAEQVPAAAIAQPPTLPSGGVTQVETQCAMLVDFTSSFMGFVEL